MLAGLVRAVVVVMGDVVVQDRKKVPFAIDEHPVGALAGRGSGRSAVVTGGRQPRLMLLAGAQRAPGFFVVDRMPAYAHVRSGQEQQGIGVVGRSVTVGHCTPGV